MSGIIQHGSGETVDAEFVFAVVDGVSAFPDFREIAEQSREEFARSLLERYRGGVWIAGYNFTFGRGAAGDAAYLSDYAAAHGVQCRIVQKMEQGGDAISSTRIRSAVRAGDMALAAELLGRPYSIAGQIVHGREVGRTLGFPTANIAIPDTMLPAPGVYATRVVVPHLGKTLQAVTNIGRKPTFGDYGLSIESFLLDTDLNLYGSELRLDFVARLRDEKRFDSADALVAQIRTDVARARDLLTMYF
mgnify:CR=1 FL=1